MAGSEDPVAESMTRKGPQRPWRRWQDWVNLLLGIWLAASPLFIPGGYAYLLVAWVVGAALVLLCVWALGAPQSRLLEFLIALLGLILLVCAWLLDFDVPSAGSNALLIGVAVASLSLWAASRIPAGATRAS